MSNNLDWSIPVADYTPAHWAAINASEAEREARKSNYEDDDLDYPAPTEAEMKADYDRQWLDCIGANDL